MSTADSRDKSQCVFCQAYASENDRETLTLGRGTTSFSLLNLYPYTTGHAMVAPIKHCSDMGDVDVDTLAEMMATAQNLMASMKMIYKPHGFNVGFNVGEAAGAGIEEHLHLHIVPRWRADNNFMTVVGGSRVIPEDIDRTFERMSEALSSVIGETS